MSEEERQAIIHLLDKQARYEYCIKNNISFSDEDYEAYIIRQSMINKDKEIERLNYKIKSIAYQCYKSDMSYEEFKQIWVNAMGKIYEPSQIDELEKELGVDKE